MDYVGPTGDETGGEVVSYRRDFGRPGYGPVPSGTEGGPCSMLCLTVRR